MHNFCFLWTLYNNYLLYGISCYLDKNFKMNKNLCINVLKLNTDTFESGNKSPRNELVS